jgi:hypothetical protein
MQYIPPFSIPKPPLVEQRLYLDGVGTFAVKIFQGKALLNLLEEQLNLPALPVKTAMISAGSESMSFVNSEISLYFSSSTCVTMRGLCMIADLL